MRNNSFAIAQQMVLAPLLVILSSGCSTPQKRSGAGRSSDHAFIAYWPPPKDSNRLRLAVKDLIDMKGVVTTAGSEYLARTYPPAKHDAKCLEIARERNVAIVGKTNLTEFAVGTTGVNDYFGTPVNRLNHKRNLIPGGSSSGAAVAVQDGMADVSFGTDSAGSIRTPAAFCGILGLKTTYGLVPLEGVFQLSPTHMDTIGPMARDIPRLVQGMDLLQRGFAGRYEAAVEAKPLAKQIRIGRLYVDGTAPAIDKALDEALAAKGFRVVKMDKAFKDRWDQAEKDAKTVALADIWLNDQTFLDKKGVTIATKLAIGQGKREYTGSYNAALRRRAAWRRAFRRDFRKVDFIALPTIQQLPPTIPFFGRSIVFELQVLDMQNTAAVNFAGNPALAIPIPMKGQSRGQKVAVTSLQLIGPRLSEAQLLNAGRIIESSH